MGGGGEPHEVPDWRSYKADGIPQLDQLQKRLAVVGLRDPWIRNEVWRHQDVQSRSLTRNAFRWIFRGFGYAVVAMALTIAYDKATKGKDDHGHH